MQNRFAFKHNKNSRKTAAILSIPNVGCCRRCTDIIEWRKRYRKYKPIRHSRRCKLCQQKSIIYAYHVVCDSCSKANQICCKCCGPKTEDPADDEKRQDELVTAEELRDILDLEDDEDSDLDPKTKQQLLQLQREGKLTHRILMSVLDDGSGPAVAVTSSKKPRPQQQQLVEESEEDSDGIDLDDSDEAFEDDSEEGEAEDDDVDDDDDDESEPDEESPAPVYRAATEETRASISMASKSVGSKWVVQRGKDPVPRRKQPEVAAASSSIDAPTAAAAAADLAAVSSSQAADDAPKKSLLDVFD